MIIAFTWAWDGAELMHKAQDMKQTLTFAGVMIGGLVLFFFNAFLEIPHFFQYSRPSEVLSYESVFVSSFPRYSNKQFS